MRSISVSLFGERPAQNLWCSADVNVVQLLGFAGIFSIHSVYELRYAVAINIHGNVALMR